MIAVDSSTLIAYLEGDSGFDVSVLDEGLRLKHILLPPVVLSEILSSPKLPAALKELLQTIPLLPVLPGYWERVGLLRSKVLGKKLKARLADSLVAQSCLDHQVALLTRDQDFKNFEKVSAIKLLKPS